MTPSPKAAKETPPENIMGTLPIPKVLMSVSLPMMISMLVLSLYNVVDSIFVGMISENALAAVSLAFPVQILVIAVSGGTGVGVNAVLSRALGEKNFKKADKAAMNGLLLALLSSLVFVVIGLTCVKPFSPVRPSARIPRSIPTACSISLPSACVPRPFLPRPCWSGCSSPRGVPSIR